MIIAVVSDAAEVSEVLPSLPLLSHEVELLPLKTESINNLVDADVALVDVTGKSILGARDFCRAIAAAIPDLPIAVAIAESSVIALDGSWAVHDFLLPSASPVEIDARMRLLLNRQTAAAEQEESATVVSLGGLTIDEVTYVARVDGKPLDLTYKEFELLRFLVKNTGRVYSREQLLQDVWGYDYFGGARTVDVHVRRLRAKLGREYERVIATVRNVGYKAVDPEEME